MGTQTARVVVTLALIVMLALPVVAAPKFSDWSAPQNLGCQVNSSSNDLAPALSKDGLSLYFSSDRPDLFGPIGA